jgi:hypothetical protein
MLRAASLHPLLHSGAPLGRRWCEGRWGIYVRSKNGGDRWFALGSRPGLAYVRTLVARFWCGGGCGCLGEGVRTETEAVSVAPVGRARRCGGGGAMRTRPPLAGRRGIKGVTGGLLAEPRRATGNGACARSGRKKAIGEKAVGHKEETMRRCLGLAALWFRARNEAATESRGDPAAGMPLPRAEGVGWWFSARKPKRFRWRRFGVWAWAWVRSVF